MVFQLKLEETLHFQYVSNPSGMLILWWVIMISCCRDFAFISEGIFSLQKKSEIAIEANT